MFTTTNFNIPVWIAWFDQICSRVSEASNWALRQVSFLRHQWWTTFDPGDPSASSCGLLWSTMSWTLIVTGVGPIPFCVVPLCVSWSHVKCCTCRIQTSCTILLDPWCLYADESGKGSHVVDCLLKTIPFPDWIRLYRNALFCLYRCVNPGRARATRRPSSLRYHLKLSMARPGYRAWMANREWRAYR